MEFLTSCLWNFCLIYGILAFSDENSRFESGSPAGEETGLNKVKDKNNMKSLHHSLLNLPMPQFLFARHLLFHLHFSNIVGTNYAYLDGKYQTAYCNCNYYIPE